MSQTKHSDRIVCYLSILFDHNDIIMQVS